MKNILVGTSDGYLSLFESETCKKLSEIKTNDDNYGITEMIELNNGNILTYTLFNGMIDEFIINDNNKFEKNS